MFVILHQATIGYILLKIRFGLIWFMVFNATLNNNSAISWRSDLLMEETGVHGENYRKSLTNFIT